MIFNKYSPHHNALIEKLKHFDLSGKCNSLMLKKFDERKYNNKRYFCKQMNFTKRITNNLPTTVNL